jgi:IS6 family transposase
VINSRSAWSAPAGYRFPREVIAVAVRWYLRYGQSYRDLEELLAERGIEVDHVTISRWVQTFTPEFIDAARPPRHATGDRWFVDETYVKVAGRWTYLYRAVDQHGQIIDVLVSQRRDARAARGFFTRALKSGPSPVEVTSDRAPAYPRVIDELVPAARHDTEQYANKRVEADPPCVTAIRALAHDIVLSARPGRSARLPLGSRPARSAVRDRLRRRSTRGVAAHGWPDSVTWFHRIVEHSRSPYVALRIYV